MNVAIFILEVLGVVAMVLVHRRSLGIFADRLAKQDEVEEARRVAAYKMAKANERQVARSDRAVRKMVDQTSALRDETISLQQRMDKQIQGGES